jgi:hypothetical protein
MTVAELISKLQEQDGDAKIVTYDTEFAVYYEMTEAFAYGNGYVVISRSYNAPPIEGI